MNIFSLFTLLGGLAFFLFGMHTMSNGLERVAGGRLESTIRVMTDTPLKSLALGAGITAAIQSSSAVTVMLVGLVNSGIMQFSQTVGVIMGSNIGTTITAWVLSLAGIESDNFFVSMLKPSNFSPLIALAGVILIMLAKKSKSKDIGTILMGFAVLMYGMQLMSSSTAPLADMPSFGEFMIMFNNPLFGLLIGIVLTAVVQSSAATIGILQALSMTGAISYGMAIPIIMGQNIGTCVTSLISSIGVSKNAKRVSVIHVYFNLIGTIIFLSLFLVLDGVFNFSFTDAAVEPQNIALIHSAFNIGTTILLFPFMKQIEWLAIKTVKTKDNEEENAEKLEFLDERLMNTPSVAVNECKNRTVKMATIAAKAIKESISLLQNYDEKVADKVMRREDMLDNYEDHLGTFLVKISNRELSDADSQTVSTLLHTIGDFERIGDHAVNILKVAKEIHEKKIEFSSEAQKELDIATHAVLEIVEITVESFCENNVRKALQTEPLEQVIDGLLSDIKDRHIKRLTGGNCTIELGFVLSDMLTNYERVSDHCSNIAVCIIQINQSVFDTHDYLNKYKNSGNVKFNDAFEGYKAKYYLPENN